MIIGFDAKRAFKNNTGLGNYSRMVVSGIARLHPETRLLLFTPSRKGNYSSFYEEFDNVVIVEPTGLWRLFPSLWRTFGVGFAVRRHKVDLFHGLSHELPLALPKGVKKVVTMHDLISWRFPGQFHFFDRLIYRVKFSHACRVADNVVAVSRQTAADLTSFLHVPQEKIKVVYQSCDNIFFTPVTDEQRADVRRRYALPSRYLLCVGTIEERKNQAAAVRAMALLPDDLHLVVVGRPTAYFEKVQAAVRESRVEERVHFLHNALFSDFPALYSEAQASVYVSRFEGFGIPVLESMRCGTPVVAANCSSLPEVGGDAALYADPDIPDDIAKCVGSVLGQREHYSTLCFSQSEKFSPDKISEEIYGVYCVE